MQSQLQSTLPSPLPAVVGNHSEEKGGGTSRRRVLASGTRRSLGPCLVPILLLVYALLFSVWSPSQTGRKQLSHLAELVTTTHAKAVVPLLLCLGPVVLLTFIGIVPMGVARPNVLRPSRCSVWPLSSPASLCEAFCLRWMRVPVRSTQPQRTPLLQLLFLLSHAAYLCVSWARRYKGRLDDKFWMSAGNAPAILALYDLSFFLIPVSFLSPVMIALSMPVEAAISLHRLAGSSATILAGAHGLTHFLRFLSAGDPADATLTFPSVLNWLLLPPLECMSADSQSKFPYTCDDCSCYDLKRNAIGSLAFLTMIAIAQLSTPRIRRHFYRLFYASHVLLAPVALALIVLHWNKAVLYILPSLLCYVLSKTLTTLQALETVHVSNTPLPESRYHIIQLPCAPLPAGSFVRIAPPLPTGIEARLRWLLTPSHPFTVVGSDIIYAPSGPFTRSLPSLQSLSITGPFSGLAPLPEPTDIYVAGGVGITPFLRAGGCGATLVWCCRDAGLIAHLSPMLSDFGGQVRVYKTDGSEETEGSALLSLDVQPVAETGQSAGFRPNVLSHPSGLRQRLGVGLVWVVVFTLGIFVALETYEKESYTIVPRWRALRLVLCVAVAGGVLARASVAQGARRGLELEEESSQDGPRRVTAVMEEASGTPNVTYYTGRPKQLDFPEASAIHVCGPASLRRAVASHRTWEEVFEW